MALFEFFTRIISDIAFWEKVKWLGIAIIVWEVIFLPLGGLDGTLIGLGFLMLILGKYFSGEFKKKEDLFEEIEEDNDQN